MSVRPLKKRRPWSRPDSFSSAEGDSCGVDTHSHRSLNPSSSMVQDERFPMGTIVKKYFHGHGWCLGQVVAFAKGRYQVQFEHLASKKDCFYELPEMPRLIKTALVVPGTRLEIYWPHEQRYYKALIKSEQARKRENYLVCYEDRKSSLADREWIDLHRHKFRILETPQQHRTNAKEDVVVVVQPDASDENDDSLDSWGKATSCDDKCADVVLSSVPKAVTSTGEDDIAPPSSVQFVGDDCSNGLFLVTPGVGVSTTEREVSRDDENVEKVSPSSSSNSRCFSIVAKLSELDVLSPDLQNPDEEILPLPVVSNDSSPRRKYVEEEPVTTRTTSPPLMDTTMEDSSVTVVVTSMPVKGETLRRWNGRTSFGVNTESESTEKEEGIIIDPDSDPATRSAVCSLIEVGSRVAVYWEEDDQFFPGTITDRSFRGKPFYLEYDDGEEEWIDLRKHRFRLLPPAVKEDATAPTSRFRRPSNNSEEANIIRTRKQQQQLIAKSNLNQQFVSTSPNSRQTRSSTKNDSPRSSVELASLHLVRSASDEPTVQKSKRAVSVKKAIVDSSDSSVSAESEYSSAPLARKQRPVDRRDRVDADIAQITVGSRVAVWWDGDKRYYSGVVQRQRTHKKPFYLVYDDGEEVEWIDFRQQKFKLLSSDTAAAHSRKKEKGKKEKCRRKTEATEALENKPDISKNVIEQQENFRKKRCSNVVVANDALDATNENIADSGESGRKRKYADSPGVDSIKSCPDVCSLITVGSRVAVYWEGDSKYYEGVVTRERNNSKKRHYLEYDDGEAAHWIDFREHWVRILPETKPSRRKRCIYSTTKLKDENEDAIMSPQVPIVTRSKKQKTCDEFVSVEKVESSKTSNSRIRGSIQKPEKDKKSSLSKSNARSTPSNNIVKSRVDSNKRKESESDKSVFEKASSSGQRKSDNDRASRGKNEKERISSAMAHNDNSCLENFENLQDLSNFAIGSRVEIWWNGDEKFYKGTISKITPKKFFVHYDDGEEEWVSKVRQKYRLLEAKKPTICSKPKKVYDRKVDLELVDSSDDQSTSSEEDHMAYDDFVFGKVDKLRVGSRISVWWTGDKKYYNGTLKKINDRTGVRRPYFVRYDDHDEEWTDLRRRYFRVLD